MKKQNLAKGRNDLPLKNPVAKFALRFHKAKVFEDKRSYKRKAKHKDLEPFSIVFRHALEKGSRA